LDIKKVGITQNNNWNEPRQTPRAGEGVTGEPGANERERSEREVAGGSPSEKVVVAYTPQENNRTINIAPL